VVQAWRLHHICRTDHPGPFKNFANLTTANSIYFNLRPVEQIGGRSTNFQNASQPRHGWQILGTHINQLKGEVLPHCFRNKTFLNNVNQYCSNVPILALLKG